MALKSNVLEESQPEEEEEIYEVEKIVKHRLDTDGNLEYLIKWVGYPHSDNTWTLEKDAFCAEEIVKYWKQTDQLPPPNTKAAIIVSPKKPTTSKRSTASPAGDTTTASDSDVPSKTRKRKSTATPAADSEEYGNEGDEEEFDADTYGLFGDSWESQIAYVDTMEKKNETLFVFFTLRNGKKGYIPTKIAYERFPQKMLSFYENHVRFRSY